MSGGPFVLGGVGEEGVLLLRGGPFIEVSRGWGVPVSGGPFVLEGVGGGHFVGGGPFVEVSWGWGVPMSEGPHVRGSLC